MTDYDTRPAKRTLLPTGIDSFAQLIRHCNPSGNGYLFVDKTTFIKAFLEATDKITLITRPRRFGKTLMLSMLEHFLAQEVNGRATKGLFDGLAVSHRPEVMKHQGQYPVIFLTLKDVRGVCFEDVADLFKNTIQDLYHTHAYLLDSDKITSVQKQLFEKF